MALTGQKDKAPRVDLPEPMFEQELTEIYAVPQISEIGVGGSLDIKFSSQIKKTPFEELLVYLQKQNDKNLDPEEKSKRLL